MYYYNLNLTWYNYVKKKHFSLGLIIVIVVFFPLVAQSQHLFQDTTTIGIQSGYSIPFGYYADGLKNGAGVGVFGYIPFNQFCMLPIQLIYNRYGLENSVNSAMQSFGIYILPSLYYIFPFDVIVHTGAGISFQYITLSAIKTNATDSTRKIGFSAIAGIAKTVFPRTLLISEILYSVSELSHKKFQTITFAMKAGYQFSIHDPSYYAEKEKIMRTNEQISYLLSSGVDYLSRKDASHALELFNQVLSLKSDHKEALQYVAVITQAMQQYDAALHLMNANNDLEALPLLVAASQYIDKAEHALNLLKQKNTSRVPELLNKGIEAFNKQQYDDCIEAMNTVLILDPDNQVARAYMVRSKRIKETLLKLQ